MRIKTVKNSHVLALFLLCLFFNSASFAKTHNHDAKADPEKISITVKGNERVDNDTVISYLASTDGKKFSQKTIDESLKKLYESDLFSEVKIYAEDGSGKNIIIEVKENPVISDIKFIGNITNFFPNF